jgi:hypothetical protein
MLPCSLQKWWKLVEDLSRENDACRAYWQSGNPQRLGRPCVAGVAKIVRSSGGIKDALGIETGTNAAGSPFLVCSQIVPQQLRETFDTTRRHVDNNSVRNPEKRFRGHFEWNDEHDCRSRSDGPENVADARISSHVVIARSPAEDKVACARKFRFQSGQRTIYRPHWQSELGMPAARDDINYLSSRCGPVIGPDQRRRAATGHPQRIQITATENIELRFDGLIPKKA